MMEEKELTADQLIDAIRSASSLAELRRLVGPTAEQNEASRNRCNQIEQLYKTYGYEVVGDTDVRVGRWKWPWHAQERLERLEEEQRAYEAEYC